MNYKTAMKRAKRNKFKNYLVRDKWIDEAREHSEYRRDNYFDDELEDSFTMVDFVTPKHINHYGGLTAEDLQATDWDLYDRAITFTP